MDRRLELHHKLQEVYTLATKKSHKDKIYYQPPSNVRLTYPCIIYKLSEMPSDPANNYPYKIDHQYELTVIDPDPNSPLREAVARMQKCRAGRVFESDNLHHYVFYIFD